MQVGAVVVLRCRDVFERSLGPTAVQIQCVFENVHLPGAGALGGAAAIDVL
jgi:hypothetical protein